MQIAWLYILIALLGAAAAVFLWRAVKETPTRARIGAWISIVIGISFFFVYLVKGDRDPFVLILGLLCALAGAHSVETNRVNERIHRLEDEIRAARGAGGEPSAKL
jgi:hypothetical protein